jgi:hypothetical protein
MITHLYSDGATVAHSLASPLHLYENVHTPYFDEHLKKLNRLILKFMKSVTKSTALSIRTLSSTEKTINHKYNTYIKSKRVSSTPINLSSCAGPLCYNIIEMGINGSY